MKGKEKSLEGRWAIVTGAEGGIGKEFCRVLAAKGASLVMAGIRKETLEAAAAEIASGFPIKTLPLHIDLTAPDAVDSMLSFIARHGVTPYILINNAGIFSFRSVVETPPQKIDSFIRLHVEAVTRLTREISILMAEAGEGKILNMSSMSCWMPMPGIALYSATKAYIRVLTRAMHYELREKGVSLTAACPGGIATDLFGLPDSLKRLAVGIGVLDRPDKFASKAVRAMMKGKKQHINGLINRLSIFFVAIMPTSVRMMVKHQLLDRGITR